MPYRQTLFAPQETYHICNRGNHKETLFEDDRDYTRFLFAILWMQGTPKFTRIGEHVSSFLESGTFSIPEDLELTVAETRSVALVHFTIMPNHFHLILTELADGGISLFMQRVLKSYAKYRSKKKGLSGHIFQGPFRANHITSNEQLLYVSTYVHRNVGELRKWQKKEHLYPWSSLLDCVGKNRWPGILLPDLVLDQFPAPREYRNFVRESPAKSLSHDFFSSEIEQMLE